MNGAQTDDTGTGRLEATPRVRVGLKAKLLVVIVVCVLLPGAWLVRGMQSELSDRQVAELKQTSDVVALLVANMRASASNTQEFERGMLSRFVRQAFALFPNIAYLVVTDGDGTIEYGRVNPELVRVPDDAPPLAVLEFLAQPQEGLSDRLRVVTVDMQAPSTVAPLKNVGTVKAAFTLNPLKDSLAEIRKQAVITLVLVLGLGVIAALLVSRSLARPIERIAAAMSNVGRGVWERIDLRSADEVGVMAHAYNGMIEGLRAGQHVEDRFRRYVSSEIVDEILAQHDQLNLTGERRQVTILFSDIRGFTSMSEIMSPDAVMRMLNDYFAAMNPVVLSTGGMLDKFIGDAIMAVWGAPLDCEDQEERAVQAGMMMLDALDALNDQRLASGQNPIEVGIGINSGVAVAGNVGNQDRLSYTVIGDVVNVAQRIEGMCRQYPDAELIIGADTYERLRESPTAEELPLLTVKGRAQPVRAFGLRRPKSRNPLAAVDGSHEDTT